VREAWDALNKRGGCSSLFSSWEWQSNWWRVWGAGRELRLYTFNDEVGQVVGIAPLYVQHSTYKKLIRLRQLQLVGNVYPTDETVLSEYADIVAEPSLREAVVRSLQQLLRREQWDEFFAPFAVEASGFYRLHTEFEARHSHLKHEGQGVRVDVSGGFHNYVAALGKHTRLKLVNRRTLLRTLGEVEIVYADSNNVDAFLARLNSLDRLRWARDCFGPLSLNFHSSIARMFALSGGLKFSALQVNGNVVSVLYNICHGGIEYNIQSAFDPDFHSKISLGTLHLGYALERAFDDESIKYFDLLFGGGKKEFYKIHYRGKSQEFYTLILSNSRRAVLKNAFRAIYGSIAD
jgi:hypothetical protein